MSYLSLPDISREQTRKWLALGIIALAIAGVFSIVLVVARTPQIAEISYFHNLFGTALVAHVDLSVIVWFLCIAALLWEAACTHARFTNIPMLLMAAGTMFISITAFIPGVEVYKSNYIPVIPAPLFLTGLLCVLIGSMWAAVRLVFFNPRPTRNDRSLQAAFIWGARQSALIVLAAFLAFLLTYMHIPPVIEGEQSYEIGFWAGGHLLQFAWTHIEVIAWFALLITLFPNLRLGFYNILAPLTLNTCIAAIGLYGVIAYPVESMEFRQFYTLHMIIGGGLAPLLTLGVIGFVWKKRETMNSMRGYLSTPLIASIALFLYGGLLGVLIQGQDVTIPAHYHGAIVAVTIALMGLAYLILPAFGYAESNFPKRLMFWQPVIYAAGQLLHISGLAWSGGYGVLRKTPGSEGLSPDAIAALGMMGAGGLIAIIGGLLFVVIVGKIMWGRK